MWVSHARRAALEQADDKLHGGPELVVEGPVCPADARRDRELKVGLYGRRGVDEYWLLDPAPRTVSVYRQSDDALVLVAVLDAQATLTSPMLPGFAAPVASLFPASIAVLWSLHSEAPTIRVHRDEHAAAYSPARTTLTVSLPAAAPGRMRGA